MTGGAGGFDAGRRGLPALAGALAVPLGLPGIARGQSVGLLPGIFSIGQSQTGRGGTNPPRTGAADTDSVARFPSRLFQFRMASGADGNIVDGVVKGTRPPRPINRFDPADAIGFMPYRDPPGTTVNAATPFLFALTARLKARGVIPNGMFGFTAWEGGAPLNAFLPPGDPDAQTDPAPASNYENLVAAMTRYAAIARGLGFTPSIPLIRFEHGEARIAPYGRVGRLRAEKALYVAAHQRLTDALVAAVRGITGQGRDPVVLLGGWGGTDTATTVIDTAFEAMLRLTAARPNRYVGPTSSCYMGPLNDDGGASSPFHPGFVGRVIVGEAQARAADRCLDDRMRPVPGGFAPLACIGIAAADATRTVFDLNYRRPPGAVAGIGFVTDAWLPATPFEGFEYLGADAAAVRVVGVAITGLETLRVTLSAAPSDAAGRLCYAYGPRAPAEADGKWNTRGNLVCPNGDPFFYAPLLAGPPWGLVLPPTQREVAVAQALALP